MPCTIFRCLALFQVHCAQPHRVDVLLLQGAVQYQLHNFVECVACNDRAIVLDPTLAEAHANLANALQQLGSTDLAIVYYQSALRLKPTFTDAYNNLASALVQKGMISQAMEAYATALSINPGLVRASGGFALAASAHAVTHAVMPHTFHAHLFALLVKLAGAWYIIKHTYQSVLHRFTCVSGQS